MWAISLVTTLPTAFFSQLVIQTEEQEEGQSEENLQKSLEENVDEIRERRDEESVTISSSLLINAIRNQIRSQGVTQDQVMSFDHQSNEPSIEPSSALDYFISSSHSSLSLSLPNFNYSMSNHSSISHSSSTSSVGTYIAESLIHQNVHQNAAHQNHYTEIEGEVRYACMEDWGKDNKQLKYYYSVTLMIAQYFFPLVVLIITYTRIGFVVWGKRAPGEAEDARDARMAASKRKVRLFTSNLIWDSGKHNIRKNKNRDHNKFK